MLTVLVIGLRLRFFWNYMNELIVLERSILLDESTYCFRQANFVIQRRRSDN
jgi:hypothetical protein